MEDVGQRVMWGPEPILAWEGPQLAPLKEALEEASGATPVQEDGATVEDDAAAY